LFVEEIIDACVMECYFRDHMADRDLLFHNLTKELVTNFDAQATDKEQLKCLSQFYQTANAPDHPIRNRLLRLTADSPDLLAVIKEYGAV
jgi:adenine-specific DNA-methyltransferase